MKKIIQKLHNHFIPNKNNDQKPHFLGFKSILFVLIFVLILEFSFVIQTLNIRNNDYLAAVLPGVLTLLTNEERANNQAGNLTENDLLKKAAQLKANDMAEKGYFSHNTPDGKTPWYFLEKVNYKYKLAGENLAVNFTESVDVSRAWMNSPGHRANILKKEYTEIGIATAEGIYEGQNAIFVVQFFGKPLDLNNKVVSSDPVLSQAVSSLTKEPTQVLGEDVAVKTTPKKIAPKTVVKNTTNTNTKTSTKVAVNNTNKETTLPASTEEIVKEDLAPITVAEVSKSNQIINKDYINELLTSPNYTVSNIIYVILGLFLIIFFIYLIRTEIMHPSIVVHSFVFIFIVFGLLFANTRLTNREVKIPLEANAINSIAL